MSNYAPLYYGSLAGVNNTLLRERVGHYLFGIRSGFSVDQTVDIDDCIEDGLHRVYAAHDWSYFRPIVDIATTAPYTTGTITIASGVVTLTGGTFPSWAAKGLLLVSSNYYSIASRDSSTQITLNSTSVTVAAASTFQLGRPEIPLADDFDAIANDSDLMVYPDANNWYPPVKQRHDSTIRRLETTNPEFDTPVFYSIRTERFDPEIGSRKVLVLYPTPDQAYTLRVPVILRPFATNQTDPSAIGAEVLYQVILEASLAAAEHNFEEREHVHEKRFLEMLALAIRNDQERSTATSLGPDAPRDEYGCFSVRDVEYRLREQRLGQISLDGTNL